jgi:hypothetical protein
MPRIVRWAEQPAVASDRQAPLAVRQQSLQGKLRCGRDRQELAEPGHAIR